MQYHFSGFVFDEDRFELRKRTGAIVPLQPKALELLLFLLRRPRTLLTGEAIMREVWGGVTVSSGALSLQVFRLREALNDTDQTVPLIQTVRRQGLRFDADVVASLQKTAIVYENRADALAEPTERAGLEIDRLGKKPTIAVLELDEHGSVEDLTGLARALSTDMIAALSRLRLLRVSSRASSFRLRKEEVTPALVKSALGADYCLMGSLGRVAKGYAAFIELVRTDDNEVVWAENYEIGPEDLHDLRSAIVGQVVSRIEHRIPDYEARKLHFRQPESLTAWQAYHVGIAIADRRGLKNTGLARRYFERAIAIDPSFSRAWSGLAHTHFFDAIGQSSDIRKPAIKALVRASEKALEADQHDPEANLYFGRARSAESGHELSRKWFEQAIELAPSYAVAYQELGTQQLFAGNPKRAFQHSSTAIALNPQSVGRFNIFRDLAIAKQAMGDFEESLKWGCKAGEAPYNEIQNLVVGLCSNHAKGNKDTAEDLARRIKGTFPNFSWEKVYGTNMLGDDGKSLVESVLALYDI